MLLNGTTPHNESTTLFDTAMNLLTLAVAVAILIHSWATNRQKWKLVRVYTEVATWATLAACVGILFREWKP
jgi:hypothetical protein